MDFSLDKKHEMARSLFRDFAENEVKPLAQEVDETEELIVISDDISLDVGQLRIRKKGSAGGHNGLKNIIMHLGHDTFQRVKMGVGEKPKHFDLADYVLGHFSKEERSVMNDSIKDACKAIEMMINDDVDGAMNIYNKKKLEK